MKLDTDITELEKEKLRAEIQEIKAKTANEPKKKRETIRGWATLIVTLLTIAATIITLGEGLQKLLKQRQIEHDFVVSDTMVKLLEKMNEAQKIVIPDSILLFSTYGEPAAPILLNKLNTAEDMILEAVLDALSLIQQNERVDGNVYSLLEKQTRELPITKSLLDTEEAQHKFTNHIKAVGRLGVERPTSAIKTLAELVKRFSGIEGSVIADALSSLANKEIGYLASIQGGSDCNYATSDIRCR